MRICGDPMTPAYSTTSRSTVLVTVRRPFAAYSTPRQCDPFHDELRDQRIYNNGEVGPTQPSPQMGVGGALSPACDNVGLLPEHPFVTTAVAAVGWRQPGIDRRLE
jgi:hypothetical protein